MQLFSTWFFRIYKRPEFETLYVHLFSWVSYNFPCPYINTSHHVPLRQDKGLRWRKKIYFMKGNWCWFLWPVVLPVANPLEPTNWLVTASPLVSDSQPTGWWQEGLKTNVVVKIYVAPFTVYFNLLDAWINHSISISDLGCKLAVWWYMSRSNAETVCRTLVVTCFLVVYLQEK